MTTDTGSPDTARLDSGQDSAVCASMEGGGCGQPGTVVRCGEFGDTAGEPPELRAGQLEGDGCGGQQALVLGPGLGWLVLLAIAALRRATPLVLLLLALPAHAVDVQRLQTADGGTFVALREGDLGAPWTPRLALGASYASNPAVLVTRGVEEPVVDDLLTTELGASLSLARVARVGLTLPTHVAWRYLDEPGPPMLGNPGFWVQVPLSRRDAATQWTWTVGFDVARAPPQEVLLGDPGAVLGGLAASHRSGPVIYGLDVGVRLQQPVDLPGLTWGNRLEYAAGVAWMPEVGRFGGSLELQGGAPLPRAQSRAAFPIEGLLTGRVALGRDLALRGGGGLGLTRGIGAPEYRGLLVLEATPQQPSDRDADGIVDVRDRCPRIPEDHDGFKDRDGCPELDNDEDGLLDPEDRCPVDAEVFNGWADADGCPDFLSTVELVVHSSRPGALHKARVRVGDTERTVLPGDVRRLELPPGVASVHVEAKGHRTLRKELPLLTEGPYRVPLVLEAIDTGEVAVRLLDGPTGAPVAGLLLLEDAEIQLPVEGARWTLEAGTWAGHVEAPGYLPQDVALVVRPDALEVVEVSLDRRAVALVGHEVRLGEEVHFALDRAELNEESQAVLDRLAAWLRANPDVELLRIDGHADGLGTPAYNYRLSLARAEAVQAHLVDAGIAAERLQAVGSGEARARSEADDAEARSVGFLVIVWDEELRARPGEVDTAELAD